eukprot:TRINITY_DN8163_c1_g1_i9.p3 TRINITY_DN8163_c1_g1~~TRINITY_DN8163_c1_g1_i9.p3  ORF type:complete len:138 (+),score=29.92 TRINITY_DN8163_c1_g1_i9:67-480(+)
MPPKGYLLRERIVEVFKEVEEADVAERQQLVSLLRSELRRVEDGLVRDVEAVKKVAEHRAVVLPNFEEVEIEGPRHMNGTEKVRAVPLSRNLLEASEILDALSAEHKPPLPFTPVPYKLVVEMDSLPSPRVRHPYES